ncbi:hypothetical protein ACJMK2_022338 [Sinanodonta woodiana]|uniref:Nucleic-acid-binding protein from transposon X-element n=1 Tax=Sinanodonta woodiana TaxID=1069815 RepID=A0ABD3TKQ4_SINWO
MSQWDDTQITGKLKEGGNKITRIYQIGRKNKKTHKIVVLETDTPLQPLIQIGQTGTKYRLEPYKNKPMFCNNCKHWGHHSSKCKNKTRCNNCGGTHKGKCLRTHPKCAQCLGPHLPKSPACQTTFRELNIINEMELRQINYNTARKLHKLDKQQLSSIVGSNNINPNQLTKIGNEITLEINKALTVLEKVINLIHKSNHKETKGIHKTLLNAKSQFQNLLTVNDPIRNG